VQLLGNRGFTVCHEKLSLKRILLKKMFCHTDQIFPIPLRFDAVLAQYLVKKYTPKIVCSFTGSAASFIRELLHEQTGGKNIYLSHSVIPPAISYYTNFDYDYSFFFGQSSLNSVLSNSVHIGNTKVVLTGSPFIIQDFELPPNREKKNILFFSTWLLSFPESGPEKTVLLKNTEMIMQWAQLHPEFHLYVKLHPLERPEFMTNLTQGIPNITVLDKKISMLDALRNISLVLHSWSAASIEAAVLKRPMVVVNTHKSLNTHWVSVQYLSLFKDFPHASTVEELHQGILQVFGDYERFLYRTQEFAKFHLEHTAHSLEVITDCIASIYHDEEKFPFVTVHEELTGLQPYLDGQK
jgi:hypothetical protein